MIRTINKHQRWLMIVIAFLAIPFVFYFNKTDLASKGADQFARIYDRNVSLTEARRDGRLFGLARALGMNEFRDSLAGVANGQNDNEISVQFIINLIILRHEAARLGIRPTTTEVADFVRNLHVFRGATGFDLNKYTEFSQNLLSPNGLTEAQVEELAAAEISLNKIKQIVATGVAVSEIENKANFEQLYSKVTVSVARLHAADFAKDIKITDEDVQKYYEAHKADFKSEEKRKVELVSLAFNDEQKKLAGKERIDVLQKLADHANDFTQALLEKGADFKQVAAKFQLPIRETGEFTQLAPDPQLKADPQLAASAFQLSTTEPNSEPIQAADGFYILHLTGVVEARPLTLEEAKPKIADAIKANRERETVSNKGAKAAHDLRESLKAGEPVASALAKANLKAEKLPPFSLADEFEPAAEPNKPAKESPDFAVIKRAVGDLGTGGVSEFWPTADGGLVVVVEKRESPDEAKFRESKATFDERTLGNKRNIVFYEWLHERQREAGVLNNSKT
jgi:peptidyl-prolyl cis-trans isomerase D